MAIQALRLPNGEEFQFDEWSHWPRYSTIDVAAASAGNLALKAFGYVVGQRVAATAGVAARQATETDTNQITKKRMNHDEAFLAYSWTYEIHATSDYNVSQVNFADQPIFLSENLRRLQRDQVISLVVGAQIQKPMARCPLAWIGQGPGSPGFGTGSAVALNVSVSHGTGGRPSPANQRTWMIPIHIESDRVYYVEVRGWRSPGVGATPALDPVTQDYRMRIYLDGLHRRPIA
jgi:hypothetical protein